MGPRNPQHEAFPSDVINSVLAIILAGSLGCELIVHLRHGVYPGSDIGQSAWEL